MSEPIIAIESREQYHEAIGATEFHLGKFRVMEYDFPNQHNQVIHEIFFSTGKESDGMYPIFCRGLSQEAGLRARVPEKYLSQLSYSLALAAAHNLSKKTGFNIKDSTLEEKVEAK